MCVHTAHTAHTAYIAHNKHTAHTNAHYKFCTLFQSGPSHADIRYKFLHAFVKYRLYWFVFKVLLFRTRLGRFVPARTSKLTPAEQDRLS